MYTSDPDLIAIIVSVLGWLIDWELNLACQIGLVIPAGILILDEI